MKNENDSNISQKSASNARDIPDLIERPMPACPHCGTKPATVHSVPFSLMPGVTALTIFCAVPSCSKIISIQVVDVQRPPHEQSRIILPN